MTSSRSPTPLRAKLIFGALGLSIILLGWQVWGLFRGSRPAPARTTATTARTTTPAAVSPTLSAPTPEHLIKTEQAPLSPKELEAKRLQQETQAKYLTGVNELQMLKLIREISEVNQAIMSSRLQTVTAQKQLIDLLSPKAAAPTPPPVQTFAPEIVSPVQTKPMPEQTQPEEVVYRVVSVMKIRSRWSAVISYQSELYSVAVGDLLPPDRSRVTSINKDGVTLERNGLRRRINLVPII